MSQRTLRIAPGFSLPLDVLTEAIGIVAVRGAGKTYTSVVLIEEAHAVGVPSVVIDATGVYHGLRTAADGEGDGLPFYVFGGPHGDLPLEPQHGRLIADVVVESGHSFVLDLSDFSKTKARQFVAEFLERLYERKARHRTPLLLVADEADEWAPQKPRGEAARCLGAMEQVAKRGRSRGIGIVLITQRTQAINKDVLDLIETLFAMRISAPRSRQTVKEWLDVKEATDELGVIDSLSSLPTGTAWVWSPVRGLLEKIAVRPIRTFNSYETPKPGQERPEPGSRASLDLEALGEQMRATVERARENDPAALRKKVAELERVLKSLEQGPEPELVVETIEVEKVVEVPVIGKDEITVLRDTVSDFGGQLDSVGEFVAYMREAVAPVVSALERLNGAAPRAAAKPSAKSAPVVRSAPAPRREPPSLDGQGIRLGRGERAVLAILAEYPEGRTHNELAFLAGYSAKASTVGVILANLRRAGLVEPGQPIRPTTQGLEAAGGVRERPMGDALLREWLSHPRMGEGERRVLLALIEADDLSHEELAEITGYSPTASTIGVILSKLRKLGLVERGARRIAPEFREAISA